VFVVYLLSNYCSESSVKTTTTRIEKKQNYIENKCVVKKDNSLIVLFLGELLVCSVISPPLDGSCKI
jgi:hypothetical protein